MILGSRSHPFLKTLLIVSLLIASSTRFSDVGADQGGSARRGRLVSLRGDGTALKGYPKPKSWCPL